jgi:elongator complex protein 2
MTHSISRLLHNFCGIDIVSSESQEELPESASLPVLGLSNKAANEQLEAGDMFQQQQDMEENAEANTPKEDILESLTSPPLEDHLQRYTLFPEIEKLYGHGYEITCCATSPSGSLIASACKSNNARHSVIRIFNVAEEYQQCAQVLEGHNLTVTSLEFSPDGQFLMSVSRDRQFSLWKIVNEKAGKFELLELNAKAHSRIIWDCSWAPSNPYGNFVVTASRDKQIKLWQVKDKVEAISAIKLQDAVTSVSCYRSGLLDTKILLAVGFENGDISLFSVDLNEPEKHFKLNLKFDSTLTPASRVAKLSFSNKLHDNNKNLMLGVASNDTSVRIYSINKEIFV